MKLLISTLVVLGSLAVATPTFAVDNSISKLCRDGAPESYSRPGGYCDAVASNKSLASGTRGVTCPAYYIEVDDHCVPL